jgi:hypothetical protein
VRLRTDAAVVCPPDTEDMPRTNYDNWRSALDSQDEPSLAPNSTAPSVRTAGLSVMQHWKAAVFSGSSRLTPAHALRVESMAHEQGVLGLRKWAAFLGAMANFVKNLAACLGLDPSLRSG